MKRSTLILLFFLIALLFWGVRYFSQHRDPIFETQLIAIDTAAVTTLSFSPGEAPDREVLAKREGKTWIASLENRAVKAPFSTMDSLLASLVRIESHHIVGKGPDVWAACGLEPGEGTRIRIFQNEKLLEDFIIGRYDPIQDGEGYTYIRLSDDESVFAVQGNLKSKLWPGFEAFRSKNFLELDPLKIQEIRWEPSGKIARWSSIARIPAGYFLETPWVWGHNWIPSSATFKGFRERHLQMHSTPFQVRNCSRDGLRFSPPIGRRR
ncbi:MAG: DUF4340 domain-containing protein [Saprospirales bacterium]|nr:DUF4340 domain-containing protein [Saprospirales bacterium]